MLKVKIINKITDEYFELEGSDEEIRDEMRTEMNERKWETKDCRVELYE